MCLFIPRSFEFFLFFCSYDLYSLISEKTKSIASKSVNDERKTQDKFIPFVMAIVYFFLFFFFAFFILPLLSFARPWRGICFGIVQTLFVTYCCFDLFWYSRRLLFLLALSLSFDSRSIFYLCCYICLHFGSLLIFQFFMIFNFSFLPRSLFRSLRVFFSRCHHFHCVCSTFYDAMQSVSDLEMPSISFNWTHTHTSRNCQYTTTKVFTFKHGQHQNQFNGKKTQRDE